MSVALALLLALQAAPSPRPVAAEDPWSDVRFMVGDWAGESEGQPGKGTVERTYRFALRERFLHEQNLSTYPPQPMNEKGEVHEHWSLFSYDRARRRLVLRQFHQEGFVNQYAIKAGAAPGSLVFESEALENVPAGWKARETYEIVSPDEFVETFELAQGGGGFEVYSRARLKRIGRAAESGLSPGAARAIADVQARLDRALAARDRHALEALTADSFVWVHGSDGRVDSREIWLANAARGMALSGQRNARTEHAPTLIGHGSPEHTVVRVARVRLLDPAGSRETWMRQTQMFLRGADGGWRLGWGQGAVMYEGPPLDAALHARYAGTYVIGPGRTLELRWEDGSLLSRLPNGSEGQVFLASPTEEAVRTAGAGRLRFTLGPDGRPVAAAMMRDDKEVWRAPRSAP